MNKVIQIFIVLLFSGTISGQQTLDYILKAKRYLNEGKPDIAIDLINSALAGKQSDNNLYILRAEAKSLKGDYTGAISDLNVANSLTPSSGEYGLARIYALKGDGATAVYHLEMNLKSEFRKSEKEIVLDPYMSLISNKPEWRQFWRKDWYSVYENRIGEIEYYVSKGKIEDAKSLLSELKSNYKSDNEVLYAEALISYYSGIKSDAINIISQLMSLDPDNVKYLRLLAKAQTGNGNYTGASDIYTKLIELEVADADLLLSRAECYRKYGESGKAFSDLERYLDIYPANKTALSMAGKIQAASGDNLKALDYFSKNIKLHPEDSECFIDRANSYFVSKSWNHAIDDYSMALDLKPDNSEIWLNKGIALINLRREVDACHDFRLSLGLGNKRAPEFISKYCIK